MNKKIKKIIKSFNYTYKNIGNIEVQIAFFTLRISLLQKHFSLHKKDYSSKRGLQNIINKRNKLLRYLKKNNKLKYDICIKKLKLRH